VFYGMSALFGQLGIFDTNEQVDNPCTVVLKLA